MLFRLPNKSLKPLIILLLWVSAGIASATPVNAYFTWAVFNTPAQKPFLETYITLVGKTLKAIKTDKGFQHSVNVVLTLYKDTSIYKTSRYNLHGPLFNDTIQVPSFIDNQRYSLPNGNYKLSLSITDNNDPSRKPYEMDEDITIGFTTGAIESSDFEILESYSKAQSPGPLTKSGFDLVPYTVNYFPETTRELAFYLEAYNCAAVLGDGTPFIFNYHLETADGKLMSSYGSFRKQTAAPVNPLLAKMDISKLGSGNYNLVAEIRDDKNQVRLSKKFAFERMNRNVDIVTLQNQSELLDMYPYFGHCNNADTLKMFVECLWPIADGVDKERIINQSVKKDRELMKKFVVDFWKRRAADTANPVKMWGTYYQSVQKAMALFKCGKQKGYYTDRGRVYLQYGPPSQRSQQLNEPNTYPYEIWQYYRTTDATNGQFFSNRKFVFVNRNLGDDCYTLIHSDMRGEVNNPRWQFDVTRRNNNGIANPDNTTPAGTENNQFNDLFNSPR